MATKAEIKQFLEDGFKEDVKKLFSEFARRLASANDPEKVERVKETFADTLGELREALKESQRLV